MKQAAIKKVKNARGSGIAEALVGFLISVLSVLALLSVASTTLELIKAGDASIQVLYTEEGAMDEFVNGEMPSDGIGTIYISSPGMSYTITAVGRIGGEGTGGTDMQTNAQVMYYVTDHHRLFGFVPD